MSLEKRKHVSQMSRSEINFLGNRMGDISTYHLTDYSYARKDTRKIFDDCIKRAFKSYDIIEYHVMSGTPRILVRGNMGELQVCMVVQPIGKKIVTMYYNSGWDNHDTLDMSLYDETINVFKTYKNPPRLQPVDFVLPVVEEVEPVAKELVEVTYHKREWLNPVGVSANSTISVYVGDSCFFDEDNNVKTYPEKKLVISDCHNTIRIHQTPQMSDQDYIDKIMLIGKVCTEFAEELQRRKV